MLQANCYLSFFLRLHQFFTADDITGIDAPARLIYPYGKAAHTTFVNITLLDTLLANFLHCFFLNHLFLLSIIDDDL